MKQQQGSGWNHNDDKDITEEKHPLFDLVNKYPFSKFIVTWCERANNNNNGSEQFFL